MGQYFKVVNIDKRETVDCYGLGSGAKAWEELANVNVPRALYILLLNHPVERGGGDLDITDNWHGPERLPEHNLTPGPMPEPYPEIAKRTIGRWVGDRVMVVGDYAEDSDWPESPIPMSTLYGEAQGWKDLTNDIVEVLKHELTDDDYVKGLDDEFAKERRSKL